MKKVLITGATGNVGIEVIHFMTEMESNCKIIAAVRSLKEAKSRLKNYPLVSLRQFDFEKTDSHRTAFNGIDILFLLRPPHISKVEKIFRPLLEMAKKIGIKNIVFLSVQGVEKSNIIPHHQIEEFIEELKFNHIFVRPSYFMQNLTTTLLPEIVNHKSITLPSGNAKFNWIDVRNIGEATVKLILDFENYKNKSYELTGTENKNFREVAQLITLITGEHITYKSMNPLSFYFKKKKEGTKSGLAVVMTILHFLPRFQRKPKLSENYQKLTGKIPTLLRDFINREKDKFTTSKLGI